MSARPITCPLCSATVCVLSVGAIEYHVAPGTLAMCPAGGRPAPFRATTTSDGPFPALSWPVDANGSPVEAL